MVQRKLIEQKNGTFSLQKSKMALYATAYPTYRKMLSSESMLKELIFMMKFFDHALPQMSMHL